VLKAEDRAVAMAYAGDVLATRTACQRWNTALKAALATLKQEETL
jgi:hypothetical protein